MKSARTIFAALAFSLVALPPLAAAQPGEDSARLSGQYAAWAGGKSNADALIGGLRTGGAITLVTTAPDGSVSLAGFTPAAPMTPGEIRSALASAQQTLSRMGIARPTAEQIQAALIGGDIAVPGGATRQVAGVVRARAGA
jgi:hypothetical protein